MANEKNNTGVIAVAIVAVVAVIAVFMLMQSRDDSGPFERAAEEMGDGLEDAARELDTNRTTGERIGDAVEDAGESIQDAADR